MQCSLYKSRMLSPNSSSSFSKFLSFPFFFCCRCIYRLTLTLSIYYMLLYIQTTKLFFKSRTCCCCRRRRRRCCCCCCCCCCNQTKTTTTNAIFFFNIINFFFVRFVSCFFLLFLSFGCFFVKHRRTSREHTHTLHRKHFSFFFW